VPNGPAVYDCCNVCNGDGTLCADCKGVCNGSAEYNACNVCGTLYTCPIDCGQFVDACGVCGGDGSACAPVECTSSSSADDPSDTRYGTPLTLNALKRRLGSLKHHRDVLKYKVCLFVC
jgi:hypothetical protein